MPRRKKADKLLSTPGTAQALQESLDRCQVKLSKAVAQIRWLELCLECVEDALQWGAALEHELHSPAGAADWHLGRRVVERNKEGLQQLAGMRARQKLILGKFAHEVQERDAVKAQAADDSA